MFLKDTEDLRGFLATVFPGLVIEGVPAESGQRVVYFCHFEAGQGAPEEWERWGGVVLKVSEGVSAQSIAYIQREIKILGELNSPGYPKLLFNEVFSAHPDTEAPFKYKRFVTIEERIQALPLDEVKDRFSTEQAVISLLHKLVKVLRPLWEWKPPLVHRDLKPRNILITSEDEVVVIDLGIVREQGSAGDTYTYADYGPCTPIYASPEQATNDKRNISFKSDLFSLGVICYELLTGSNPFDDRSGGLPGVLRKVVEENPPRLCEVCDCSIGFSNIVGKMMEKYPYKRYRRVDDLLRDLSDLQGGE